MDSLPRTAQSHGYVCNHFNGLFFKVHCLHLLHCICPILLALLLLVSVCLCYHQFSSAFAIFSPYFSCIIFAIIFERFFNHLVFKVRLFRLIYRVLFTPNNTHTQFLPHTHKKKWKKVLEITNKNKWLKIQWTETKGTQYKHTYHWQ